MRDWNRFAVPTRDAEHVLERRVRQGDKAIEIVAPFCREMRVAVQAGGNWGYWPLKLSERFGTVYTFEPEDECFVALAFNTAGRANVVRLQAALGCERKLSGMRHSENTTGSQGMAGEGIYPTLRIDDLGLEVCDLIYLDIEGMEAEALAGAKATLARARPVIAFECGRFGEDRVKPFLGGHGYAQVAAIGHDVVMRHGG